MKNKSQTNSVRKRIGLRNSVVRKSFALLFLLVSTLTVPSTMGRTWTDDKGRQIEASFVRLENKTVVLNHNGKEIAYPIDQLSHEDLVFLRHQMRKGGKKNPASDSTEGAKEKAGKFELVEVHRLENGRRCSVFLPEGWKLMPQSTIEEINRYMGVADGSERARFDFGVQRQAASFPMEYPNLLGYVSGGEVFDVDELTNMHQLKLVLEDGFEENKHKYPAGTVLNLRGTPSYDKQTRTVWWKNASHTQGVGPTVGLTGIRLLEGGFLEFHGYCMANDETAFTQDFVKIVLNSTGSFED